MIYQQNNKQGQIPSYEINLNELNIFYKQFSSFSHTKLYSILQSQLFLFPKLTTNDLLNFKSILIYLYQQFKCLQPPTVNTQKNCNNRLDFNLKQICSNIINGTFQYKNDVNMFQGNKLKDLDANQQENKQFDVNKQPYFQKQNFSFQVLSLIFKIFPKTHELFAFQRIQQLQRDNIKAILTLLSWQLQNSSIKLSLQEQINILNNILIPICVKHCQFNQMSVNLIKLCLNYNKQNNLNKKQKQLIQENVIISYLNFHNNQQNLEITQRYLKKILSYLILIQSIYCESQQNYPQNLIKSQYFLRDIQNLLLCTSSDPQLTLANSVSLNVYGSYLKQINLFNKQTQIFINLYSTLSCFGTHLIKDVWQSFYSLTTLNSNPTNSNALLSQQKLIDIIFYKIQNHDNANVIKFCLQSILKSSEAYNLFNFFPDAIYNSLIRMLNLGVHYLDCVFHMDSKTFSMIQSFFCNFYNNFCKEQHLQFHLKKFLNAIYSKLTFDHAIVAAFNCFTKIYKKTKMIGKQQLQIICHIVKKYYRRLPIRKRNQLMKGVIFLLKNNLDSVDDISIQGSKNKIKLNQLFENCLNFISQEFLKMVYFNYEAKRDIAKIINKNYSKMRINNYIGSILDQILQQPLNISVLCQKNVIEALQKTIFILGVNQLQAQILQKIKNAYQKINQCINDFGDSLYKNSKERIAVIQIINTLFKYKSQAKISKSSFHQMCRSCSISEFVKSNLNNLSLLINELLQIQYEKQEIKNYQHQFCKLVKNIFEIIYSAEQNEEYLKLQTLGAQFLQWATDKIQQEICVKLIIEILKTKLKMSKENKIQLIQQSVYQIHRLVLNQEFSQNKNLIQVQIAPILRLRLCILTSSILFSDLKYIQDYLNNLIQLIEDFIDRYDYQHYDQMFDFIKKLFAIQAPLNSHSYQLLYNNQNNHINKISKCFTTLLDCTLNNLNYGIDTKQAISTSQCAIKLMFSFAAKHNYFNIQFVKNCLRILQIGEQYWMFQRTLVYSLIFQIKKMSHQFVKNQMMINWQNLLPLLLKILCCQQYRGYDTAVVLQNYLTQKFNFYSQLKFIVSQEADYEGVICRFQFLSFIHFAQKKQNIYYQTLLIQLFKYLVPIASTQNKQKMFLTGTHKTKLKVFQCLLAYNIEWIYSHKQDQIVKSELKINLQELIIKMLNSITHNNLSEVRYYEQIFLMKIMVNNYSKFIITEKILYFLSNKLVQSISQVNKNISFLVISGILLSHLLSSCSINNHHLLYTSIRNLFNSLLSFCCSHVAYFRGISQFFCLQQNYFQTDYTKILAQNYKNDIDAKVLQQKLEVIINQYIQEIKNWQIYKDLLPKVPTLNNNVVSETYYIQKMKKLGHELVKQVKHQDGFLPYKDIWKNSIKCLQNKEQQQTQQNQEKVNYQQTQIFQKKIDPTLDFIYLTNQKLVGFNMKILVTGFKSIPLFGHLSRTGQIFGLSQLIVPDKSITELDQFKNVSCTSQKWLNISEFSNKKDIMNKESYQFNLQQKIIDLKKQNFQIIKIKKRLISSKQLNDELNNLKKNLVLIIDSQNIFPEILRKHIDYTLCFQPYFSQHVDASILIWQYLKKAITKNF